uniref:Tight junction protein 3 n=1 Tax=Strix occidentalis caurina TaxID=311401 RepID=A0A8D0FVM3_STROC
GHTRGDPDGPPEGVISCCMEEMVIWEQHTVTLSKDPQRGFGFAVSGGRDRPNRITGDTAVVVSDVVAGGPAVGRLQRKDHIVMVNGLSMDNVLSSFAIQTLKTCGKIANIVSVPCSETGAGVMHGTALCLSPSWLPCPTHSRVSVWDSCTPHPLVLAFHLQTLKRPKKVHLPVSKSSPGSPTVPRHCDSDEDYGLRGVDPALHHSRDDLDHSQGYDGDSSSERSSGHHQDDRRHPKAVSRSRRRSQDSSHWRQSPGSGSDRRGYSRHRSANGFSHEGDTNGLVLVSEYGLKLGSQLFIKHIVESGLAAKGSSLQEGDLILKINGVASEDMSLADTQQLIERTEGTLTLLILRDHRQFLVNIPDVEDSQSDNISDIESEPSHPPSPETSLQPPAAGKSVGLRLAGGNDVGIFVSSVQEGSPADSQGVQEGDQILQVNDTSFQNLTREEAVEYLMSLPLGEDITLWTQSKQDIYRKMISSNVGDSFYIRTHFDFEKDTPSGLSFTRGDVFHVLDTMYRGRLGSWLAARMGRDLQEQDKGIIPNRSSLESVLKATSGANPSGARAEFWKLRGLRGAKKMLRKSREDLCALTKQGRYPPYERVVLKEANFKRPVVILGPIADVAMQKLSTELPELFEIARKCPPCQGEIVSRGCTLSVQDDKHALLDITPSAVERLNYVQYYPVVVFCEPESRQGIKAMRQWLAPDSRKSSRRLYAQASKMKKYCSHLFTATVSLGGSSNTWYEAIKDIIRTQQSQPVWTAVEQVRGADVALEDSLDLLNPPSAAASGYLSCDSHANSDYDDTDGEAGAYTDGEAEEVYDQPGLARSSEPAPVVPSHVLSEQVGPPILAVPCSTPWPGWV